MAEQLFIGTVKGAFIATRKNGATRHDAGRPTDAAPSPENKWTIEGPLFKGWSVTAAARAGDGRYLAGTNSDVYGPAIHTSPDLRTWTQIENGPTYEKGGDRKLEQIWTIKPIGDRVYAGVAEAGLFRANGDLEAWQPVTGLNDHPTRSGWMPGAGGLCAHVVLHDGDTLWCGISAVGVFRSDDGGETWTPKNAGVKQVLPDEEHEEIGFCVHGLAADPDDPQRIYRQDHLGVYRTTDGAETWERIEKGLPAGFGFPVGVDRFGNAYVIPLESDEFRMPVDGKLRVYRSTNGGDSWEPLANGLPQENVHTSVLRAALAVDGSDPAGIFFGTTGGAVYASFDGGSSWEALPCALPRIQCVEVFED